MSTLLAKVTRPYTLACLAIGLAVSGTALAGTPSTAQSADVPSVTVRYDDLNLSSDRGVAALYKRITNAARQVCPDGYSRDVHVVLASHACQAQAVARAVQDVNSPKLASVHQARVGHS